MSCLVTFGLIAVAVESNNNPLLLGRMARESQPSTRLTASALHSSATAVAARTFGITNADGSAPMRLSKDEDRTFASPAWSPDGQYVYVARSVPSYRVYEIWMYHVLGGSGVQITRANGSAPGGCNPIHMGLDEETAVAVDVRPNTMGQFP